MKENLMKYKHLKYKSNIWLKLMFLNYLITTILAIYSFDIIIKNPDQHFIGNWYAILVVIFCAINILHFIITSIFLSFKQMQQSNKNISKINSMTFNETLFKIVKVENTLNFYLINFLNIVLIIFLAKTFGDENLQFFAHIFLILLNVLYTNIVAFQFWSKTR